MKFLFILVVLALSLQGILTTRIARFEEEPQTGYVPTPRGGATLTAVKDTLILFGGFLECFDLASCDHTWYNTTYHYDLDTSSGVWNLALPDEVPPARAFHSAAAYTKRGSVIVYGGTRYNSAFTVNILYDDMWEYFPKMAIWIKRHPKNTGPGRRVGPGLAIRDNILYLQGGLEDTGFFQYNSHNDLWSYDLKTDIWTMIHGDTNDTRVPPGRYLHKFELDDEDNFHIFSGNKNPDELGVQLRDHWVYSIKTKTYHQIELPSSVVTKVHGASSMTSKIFVSALGDTNDDLGECKVNQVSGGQNPTRTVEVYHTCGPQAGWKGGLILENAPKLKRVAYATANGNLYITGGFDFTCATEPCEDGFRCFNATTSLPIWNTKLYSLNLRSLE